MLSPRIRAEGPPRTNSAPMMNACASPSGLGWTRYSSRIPHRLPSPRSAENRGVSSGVEMISTSRIPASMSAVSG